MIIRKDFVSVLSVSLLLALGSSVWGEPKEVKFALKGPLPESVRCGFAFPDKHGLVPGDPVQLVDAKGKDVSHESLVTSLWPSGHVRSLALRFRPSLGNGQTGTFHVRYETRAPGPVRPAARTAPLQKDAKEKLLAADMGSPITVDTGTLRAFFAAQRWGKVRRPYETLGRFRLDPTPGGKHRWTKKPVPASYPRPSRVMDALWFDFNKDGDFGEDERIISKKLFPELTIHSRENHFYISHLSRPKRVGLITNRPDRCQVRAEGAMTRLHLKGHGEWHKKLAGWRSREAEEEAPEPCFLWTALLTFKKGTSAVECSLTIRRGGVWRYEELGRRTASAFVPVKEISWEMRLAGEDHKVSAVVKEEPLKKLVGAGIDQNKLLKLVLWKGGPAQGLWAAEGFALQRKLSLHFGKEIHVTFTQ